MTFTGSDAKRRKAAGTFSIDLSTACQQQEFHALDMAEIGGDQEGRHALLILRVESYIFSLQQRPDTVGVTVSEGQVQRGAAQISFGVGLYDRNVQQSSGTIYVTVSDGQAQCRPTLLSFGIDLNAFSEK